MHETWYTCRLLEDQISMGPKCKKLIKQSRPIQEPVKQNLNHGARMEEPKLTEIKCFCLVIFARVKLEFRRDQNSQTREAITPPNSTPSPYTGRMYCNW